MTTLLLEALLLDEFLLLELLLHALKTKVDSATTAVPVTTLLNFMTFTPFAVYNCDIVFSITYLV
ncbi:hypothetical protein LOCK900_2268 [Lacticaseibacillus rhamnosus LOCK900]|nr:hypothetical protein LOCK900_2268 [Lacticaseibacillus rhamnosus LOCK900]